MRDITSKRSRSLRKAGNSPLPEPRTLSSMEDPACGHSHCGTQCRVRYMGPTTHLRDHHIIHAARGTTHIWTAAIVAGLAVVLTGVIAYSSVEAAPATAPSTALLLNEIKSLQKRIDKMEGLVKEVGTQCTRSADACEAGGAEGSETESIEEGTDNGE